MSSVVQNTVLQKKLESTSEENERQLDKLQEDLKQAEFEKKRRDEQLAALINEDSERKRVDATSDKHPEELRGLKQQVAQLTRQIAEKETNCQRCRENLEQAQIAQDREISRLRKQLEAGESRMKEKMASATKIADEMKLLQGKYNMLKDQWDEIWMRQKTAEDRLQKSNEERQQLDEELESTKTMIEELRLQLEKTDEAKQNAIDTEGEDREAQLQEALKRAEQLEQTVHKLNLQIDELQSEVAARKKDIETLLVQKKNGVTLFNKLKKEKDELAEQLERIRQERGELNGKYEGLKQELRLLNEQLASSKNSAINEPNRSDRTDKQAIIASPRKPLSASTHENVPRDSA
ncbi:hypothetical protein WR25_06286 [Diploscapter pachys]|uniref:Uncharacterized protein n=1 Tax=Diploscapter pachys TaxID=2018661 RepID=A0A2A2LRE7_9BILA|nr:hypothetical protein WR25_06286 [Diploscapter pachys]